MRETQKKELVILHKNLNRAISFFTKSKQIEHNNAIEKLRVVPLIILTYILISDIFLRFNLKIRSNLQYNAIGIFWYYWLSIRHK